jgi:hypothetical protein
MDDTNIFQGETVRPNQYSSEKLRKELERKKKKEEKAARHAEHKKEKESDSASQPDTQDGYFHEDAGRL